MYLYLLLYEGVEYSDVFDSIHLNYAEALEVLENSNHDLTRLYEYNTSTHKKIELAKKAYREPVELL